MTHVALGSVRVQSTLATCGQAAGTATALCRQRGCSPRQLGQHHIVELQQQLLKMDQSIPDMRNQDPADLALRARATASSELTRTHLERDDITINEIYELTTSRAMSFPTPPEGRIETVSVLLASTRTGATRITMGLREGTSGDDFSMTADRATATMTVQPGGRRWITFKFNQPVTSPFAWVWLPRQPGIHWALMTNAPRSCHRAYGLKPDGGAQAVIGGQYMALYTEPVTGDLIKHPARFVNNGVARITDTIPNMWASAPEASLPQWLELTWDEPVTMNTVYLTFDTDLNNRLYNIPRVPQCVRDYRIQARVNGAWQELISVTQNFMRRRIHRFVPVTTQRLRVIVEATNGDPCARIYEIRAYRE